jgi:hypothetical protein
MAYIGRQNLGGAYRQLDDISSGFDGSDTTHTMQVNSTNVSVGDVNQILLSLGGVIQKPGTDFTVSGSTLTFTTAPAANTSFFAILLGSDNGGTVTPTDVSVTKAKLADEVDIFAGTSLSAADLGSGIHIKTADSGGSANSSHDEIVIEGSGQSGMTILSGASSNGAISFGDSGDSADGYINYDHANRKLDFGSATTTQWSIDSGGDLLPAAADHGIYLGVNSATAANLLDDFEFGTWTPTIGNAAGNETMTLNSTYSGTDKAFYTKVGRMVHIHGYIVVTGNGTHTNSSTYLGGLPFAVKSGDSPYSALSVGYGESLNTTAGHNMGGYARVNNSNFTLWLWDTTTGGSVILRDEISSNGGFIFSATYSTN